MHPEILKAHAMVAQKKLSLADFDALILGVLAGDHRPKIMDCPKHGATRHIWTGNAYACARCAAAGEE